MFSLSSILESLLFAHGGPVSVARLAEFAGVSVKEVVAAMQAMKKEYAHAGRGIVLLEQDGTYELGTSPDNASYIEALAKEEFTEELSRAALETIAIVAYKGPLTRVEIEQVRGVNSSFIVRNLLMRGLIERVENLDDARSHRYRVTIDFLAHLGLTSQDELPELAALVKQAAEAIPEDAGVNAPETIRAL